MFGLLYFLALKDAPFVKALSDVLQQIRDVMLYLVPGIIMLTLVIGGLMLAKAEDGQETQQVKDRMIKAIIGAALAGGATWIANDWLKPLFGLQ